MNYRYTVELKADDPMLAVSGLVGRILAIEIKGERTQIGQAWNFHLKSIGDRLALACRILVDQTKFDELREQFLSGATELVVEDHKIAWLEQLPSS